MSSPVPRQRRRQPGEELAREATENAAPAHAAGLLALQCAAANSAVSA